MPIPSANQHSAFKCLHCGEAATKICVACHEAPDDKGGQAEPTRYCSAGCQKEDWPKHKTGCKAAQNRKILCRAGDVAQTLFYMYREIVFDKSIVIAEKKGNEIILCKPYYDDTDECFFPFPNKFIPNEKDKKAVLTYLACGDAYAYMDVLLKMMLKGKSCT